jgi:hypothetical protein
MGKKYCHEHIESMPLAREIAAQLAELERQARLGAAGQLLVLEVAAWIYDRDGDASLRYLEGRAAAMKLPSKDLRLILEQMAKAGMIRIHAGKPKRIELL